MSINEYPLLIISPSEFIQALFPLQEHKRNSGMPCLLVTLEDIQKHFHGKDLPEQVKRAIAHYNQEHKARYIMLVGDTDKFPVRYIRGINTEWDTRYYPSDLYYADLYDNSGIVDDWDVDEDGFYATTDFTGGAQGVNVDKINLNPDVAVGRVPASTSQEVSNYVNKIIKYEYGAWRSSWKKRAMIVSDHDIAGCFSDSESVKTLNKLLEKFDVFKLFQKDEPYKSMRWENRAKVIVERINDGVGFVSHLGHGSPDSWSGFLHINNISELGNNDKLPIVSTIACLTANFHYGPEFSRQDRYLTAAGTEWSGQNVTRANRPMPAFL